jgi:hypothetical protein
MRTWRPVHVPNHVHRNNRRPAAWLAHFVPLLLGLRRPARRALVRGARAAPRGHVLLAAGRRRQRGSGVDRAATSIVSGNIVSSSRNIIIISSSSSTGDVGAGGQGTSSRGGGRTASGRGRTSYYYSLRQRRGCCGRWRHQAQAHGGGVGRCLWASCDQGGPAGAVHARAADAAAAAGATACVCAGVGAGAAGAGCPWPRACGPCEEAPARPPTCPTQLAAAAAAARAARRERQRFARCRTAAEQRPRGGSAGDGPARRILVVSGSAKATRRRKYVFLTINGINVQTSKALLLTPFGGGASVEPLLMVCVCWGSPTRGRALSLAYCSRVPCPCPPTCPAHAVFRHARLHMQAAAPAAAAHQWCH